MRTIFGVDLPQNRLEASVVTIGKFSAVHRGHQALLDQTVAAARNQGVPSVAATFDRHPNVVLRPGEPFPVIASLEERLALIAAQGIDIAVVFPATEEFFSLEAEHFVREILVAQLGVRQVLTGPRFRFGRSALGDLALLETLGAELGFEATVVEPVLDGGERISSSRVVQCIEAGEVANAARLLGRQYAIAGEVVEGQKLGRQLGFPTANVSLPSERLLPKDGVYIVRAVIAGKAHPGITNLGVRPTVDGSHRLLEVHLLDWEGDLYGKELSVHFLQRLRDERRFPNVGALRDQIKEDADAGRRYFEAGASHEAAR
jgi:riboflavin kinase / FMN adenylyltransferase